MAFLLAPNRRADLPGSLRPRRGSCRNSISSNSTVSLSSEDLSSMGSSHNLSIGSEEEEEDLYVDQDEIPQLLVDVDVLPFMPLGWAVNISLSQKKAETIINSFNMIKTTKDRLSRISHHILKSFFLWFLKKKVPKYLEDAKREIKTAAALLNDWDREAKVYTGAGMAYHGFVEDYIDGVEYVIVAMKVLLDPNIEGVDWGTLDRKPQGNLLAGILHVKQEFFRPFFDEIDERICILEEIRELNKRDSRACLYLAKTLGQKRKMENFISAPTFQEMELLAEGHVKAKGDHSIVIELCYCLAQFLRNTKDKKKLFPLKLYNNTMVFREEDDVAAFINRQTTDIWRDVSTDAAPLYVKLAEVHSSLLPENYRHPTISPLALVNRALEKYARYSKALHRKAKILFKLRRHEEGLKCLEAAFECGETNCDALCDLIFRLMRFPNRQKLDPIFKKYCSDYGENLWGKKKVGTLYYLYGCYLWMLNSKKSAVWWWLKAEQRNPNPTFYFHKLYTQKTNYKWHQASILRLESIVYYLKNMGDRDGQRVKEVRECLTVKLQSLLEN